MSENNNLSDTNILSKILNHIPLPKKMMAVLAIFLLVIVVSVVYFFDLLPMSQERKEAYGYMQNYWDSKFVECGKGRFFTVYRREGKNFYFEGKDKEILIRPETVDEMAKLNGTQWSGLAFLKFTAVKGCGSQPDFDRNKPAVMYQCKTSYERGSVTETKMGLTTFDTGENCFRIVKASDKWSYWEVAESSYPRDKFSIVAADGACSFGFKFAEKPSCEEVMKDIIYQTQ